MYIRCEAGRRVARRGIQRRRFAEYLWEVVENTFLAAITGHCESLLYDYDDYYYCNRYYPIIVTIIIIVIEYY